MSFSPHLATGLAGLWIFGITAGAAWPQAAPPPTLGLQSPAQQPVPAQPAPQRIEPSPPPRDENPGLINEIGKLFEKSKSLLPPLKSPSEAIDDLNVQAKGFKEGNSLDTDAAEKCSPKVYMPGYKRQPGDCKTENYVTRALCQ